MHTLKLVSLACAALVIVSSVSCGGSTTSPDAKTGDASVTDTGGAIDSGANAETSGNDATGGDVADATSGDGTASGCITDTSAGSRVFTCDGFKYDVTVPDACAAGGCGLVLDVHGATMSGKMEDANTDMRALGAKYGYVVVQPNANPAPPSSSWNPAADDPKVFAFFQDALAAF